MNMTRIRQICLRLSKLKKTDYIVILLVGVLLLIVVLPVKEDKKTCSNSQKKAKAKSVSESTCDDEEYEKLLEKKLEGILERMDGVGEVSVMITLSDDGTRIVDKDTKETSESIEKTTVIYDDEDASVPYVTSTDKPTVSGVLVVAQGGGSPQVNNDISNAVSALFDVPMHKIKIAKNDIQGGIKVKKGSHKNQIIITTLALLLAVVGYISYDNRDTFMNAKDVLSTEIEAVNGKADTKESKECEDTQASDEVALETDSTEEILNAGETVLTSASTESEECVAQVKLGREQVRSKNKEALQKIIDDAGVSEAEKKSAVDAMVKLTENAQMEEDAQMMLEAKGFKNAVVSLSDECCDVIVGKEDVTDEKRAQIEDIIKRKTNIGASNIVISTMD